MSPWTDERTEQLIGNLLRIGVIVAASVVLIGGGVYLARHGTEPAVRRLFNGEPADLTTPSGIVADARSLQGRGLIQLGILLMIAVPVLRVLCSIGSFALERDWTYVVITLTAFLILCYSLFGGQVR
ncbi:MAG TPA: DUF1634 domain-containing protein [Pirellulales bacterium]|jgi:uncharacterized membrane protein|nr:DUF1634 domain-containing protein [Pirellulales bacterium]